MGVIFGINPRNRVFLVLYVLGMHGIGSFIISGGLEFAIAYGMYTHSEYAVTLWAFPNTVSGDCALTVFIQCVVTWFLEELLIGFDIFNDAIPTFDIIQRPHNRLVRNYLEILEPGEKPWDQKLLGFIPGTPQINYRHTAIEFRQDPGYEHPKTKHKWSRGCAIIFFWLLNKAARALLLGCVLWAIIWPITMGILAGIGHHRPGTIEYTLNHFPEPQIVKLLYGGILGLFCTPIMASVILMRTYYNNQVAQSASESSDLDKQPDPTV